MKEADLKKIGPGYCFGKLTVISDTGKRKNGYIIWNCACQCGGSIELDVRTIKRGSRVNCGCQATLRSGQQDLTGMRFGKLMVLCPTNEIKKGSRLWRCVCDCDRVTYVSGSQLLSGHVKSCGCLSRPPLKDLIGKRFGKLTVISHEGKEKNYHLWRCRCDCGRETVVRQNYLQCGHTTSCGCAQREAYRNNLKLMDGTSVTLLEAGRNRLIKSNTSGYTGVYQRKSSGKWAAQITFKGKTYFLGDYDKRKTPSRPERPQKRCTTSFWNGITTHTDQISEGGI